MEISKVNIEAISLSRAEPSLEDYQGVAVKLREAFMKLGFAYISNHGIDDDVIQKAFEESKRFFTLPQGVKDKCLKQPPVEQGYVKPGQEIFDAREDWQEAAMEFRESYDISFLGGPDAKFPDEEVPQFRESMSKLAKATQTLTLRVLRSLALAINQDIDFFIKTHNMFEKFNATKMRTLFYPPLKDEQVGKNVVRCGSHSDYGTITFLYQDEIGGLEVRGTDQSWIDAKPIPGNILINMGDLTEIISNGMFPATRHRVMVPDEEIRRRTPRQSIVLFVHPDGDVLIEPLPDLNGPPKYAAVTAHQHLINRFSATYR